MGLMVPKVTRVRKVYKALKESKAFRGRWVAMVAKDYKVPRALRVNKVCKEYRALQDYKVPRALRVNKVCKEYRALQDYKVPRALRVNKVCKEYRALQDYKVPRALQGAPGLNGTNSILQVIQSQNITAANLGAYNPQWWNMSMFDSSMRLTINVQSQSRICAEFLSTVTITNSDVSFRIVVDNQYYSSTCYTMQSGTSVPTMRLPIQMKILTDPLLAGTHTIDIQFNRLNGPSTIMDRSLYVTELTAP